MRITIQSILISAALLLLYWLLPIFKPFIAGAFFAAALHKPAHFIQKKGFSSRSSAVFIALIWILFLFALSLFLFGWISARTASHLNYVIPHYMPIASAHLAQAIQEVLSFLTADQKEYLIQSIASLEQSVGTLVQDYAGKWLLIGTGYALALTGTAAEMIIAVLTAFFLVKDGTALIAFLPEQIRQKTAIAADDFSSSLYAFGYAQLQLFILTFIAASIGFFLLGIPHILELGFLTAVLEFLPIIGASLLFIPLILFSFITGQTKTALFAAILYIVLTLMRQLMEPKLVEGAAGLHPLAMLFTAFAGFQLAGVFGLIAGPLCFLAFLSMHRAGLIFTKR